MIVNAKLPRYIITLMALVFSVKTHAITVTTTDWDYPSPSFGVLNQAGDYFNSSFESSASAASMSIGSAPSTAVVSNNECGITNPAWKLNAELLNFPAGLTLRIKRTNNGIGGVLSGGTSYTVLSAVSTTLWCGWGDVSGISLQYQVDNMNVDDGSGLKAWDVRFTVETL